MPGFFDVSHMGGIHCKKGPMRWTSWQRITTNDAAKLKAGMAQYSYA